MDKLIVGIAGALGIVAVHWFFFMKKTKETIANGPSIDIRVEGGYSPESITIPVGKTTILNFTRTDPTSCLEEVVLSDFRIRRQLPLNQKVPIAITPQKTGEFTYSCGMNMYHGKIMVR
ncbi:MAG: cupredoxin domain-containing protein [Candidatus Jorgensenbacteria bacterium]|nr:cupredoxin domain-containing protein [Candidatus Jorgensenbacteria bacterium]